MRGNAGRHDRAAGRRRGAALLAVLLLLGGCAAPVSVSPLSLDASYRQLNRSALSGGTLSNSTLIVLRRHGLLAAWNSNPDAAIAALRADVVGQPALWPELFALAELSYLQGQRDNAPPKFLAAAVYAYAYLSPGGDDDRPSPYDERFRQACDIYNLGLTEALTPSGNGPVQILSGRRALPFGAIDLSVDPDQLRWHGRDLIDFEPTATLSVRGMRNLYRNPGLGEPLAALVRPDAATGTGLQVAPKLRVPVNLLLVMDAPRQQLARTGLQGRLDLHIIYDQPDAVIGAQTVPLEYDQTTAWALSFAETRVWSFEFGQFFSGTLAGPQEQLVALMPHQPGHMPVILVHGTASSAFRWADMVNDLLDDPVIRAHFEFWFFTYASGNPIPYSALQLRRSIEAAVAQLGGVKADPALGRMTLIGHSQGGLLVKMLVINPGDLLWNGVSTRPLAALQLSDKSRQLLQAAMFPTPLPEAQRVIFIATPQRGSYLAGFSISRLVARLVTLPFTITELTKEILTGNGTNVLAGGSSLRLGSVYAMAPSSPFIRALASVPVAPGVHAHSIIAVNTSGPVAGASDGVVSYASAHIAGVDSELVVRSGHSTQSNPATIAEVRRILLLQLESAQPGAAAGP